MQNSKISWTHHTFNPWWGCTKVSPGCDHCYADGFAKRVGFSETGSKLPIWGKESARRFFGDKHWADPLKWNREAEKASERRRVFCASMADVMEDRRDLDEPRTRLYGLIRETPWLDWLLLTKRPQNFRRLLPSEWLSEPRLNVWLMTTVESDDYLWRIDTLKSCPAVVHGLSIEPLLGPMSNLGEYLDGIDWVICGGESGPGARPMHPDWARNVCWQCQSKEVAFHFKQWGEWQNGSGLKHNAEIVLNDGRHIFSSDDVDQETRNRWPYYAPVMMLKVGKEKAGRELDGREWNELPLVTQDRMMAFISSVL